LELQAFYAQKIGVTWLWPRSFPMNFRRSRPDCLWRIA